MTTAMSPATEALTTVTSADVPRYESNEPKKPTDPFGHPLTRLTKGQRAQVIDPSDGPTVIRGGWDS